MYIIQFHTNNSITRKRNVFYWNRFRITCKRISIGLINLPLDDDHGNDEWNQDSKGPYDTISGVPFSGEIDKSMNWRMREKFVNFISPIPFLAFIHFWHGVLEQLKYSTNRRFLTWKRMLPGNEIILLMLRHYLVNFGYWVNDTQFISDKSNFWK